VSRNRTEPRVNDLSLYIVVQLVDSQPVESTSHACHGSRRLSTSSIHSASDFTHAYKPNLTESVTLTVVNGTKIPSLTRQ